MYFLLYNVFNNSLRQFVLLSNGRIVGDRACDTGQSLAGDGLTLVIHSQRDDLSRDPRLAPEAEESGQ